jgi:acyl-CoA synthetase (NDP forming)
MPENPLHLLLHPKSVAVAGASNNPIKMGTLQALSILKDGYEGKFYPVHPTEKTVLGHKAYASPLDLPDPPDLALLVVPTAQVVPILEDFAKIGTKRAVIISAGFKETGPEGRALEERLREIAATYGIRFLGPNCMGIVNTAISPSPPWRNGRDRSGWPPRAALTSPRPFPTSVNGGSASARRSVAETRPTST